MDIKEKIEELVNKAKNDEAFHSQLKTDPVKAIEGLTGLDLPDDQVKAVAKGVMAKLNLDAASGLVNELEGKLGGFFHKG